MDDQGRKDRNPCRVCGFINEEITVVNDGRCACCGIKRGVEDQSAIAVKMWRHKWLSLGGSRREKRYHSK